MELRCLPVAVVAALLDGLQALTQDIGRMGWKLPR